MQIMRVSLGVLLLAAVSIAILGVPPVVLAQQSDVASAIFETQSKFLQCYAAVRSAEFAGANVSSLTTVLNSAGVLLSASQLAYSNGDFASALSLADQSEFSLETFLSDAESLRSIAAENSDLQTLILVGSIIGTFAVLGGGVAALVILRRENALMQYAALFIVGIAVLALLVASPALQRIFAYSRTEFFTELSLIGPEHVAENYPYSINRGENYLVFLEIGNQLGACAYYQVEIKFRNETQSAPNSFDRTPSSLPSLYNLTAFVADKETFELPLNFSFNFFFRNVTRTLLQVNFESLQFNGETLNLQGLSSDWDPKTNVFYGNLVFELWIYNDTTTNFQYHERQVNLKFNMTATSKVNTFT